MINLHIVLAILFWHWIADFTLQTDYQANNKSTNVYALLAHTFNYSFSWSMPIIIYGIVTNTSPIIMWFIPITFLFHTWTDYFTSRLNKILWDNKKVHEFFVSIGFDQFLHFSQLLLTYYLLTK